MADHMRDRMKRDLLATWIKRGFEDSSDLHFYIQQFLGYNIPEKAYCPEHVSPFSFIDDAYFDKIRFALIYGSRGSGKTWSLALINHLKMMYRMCSIDVTVAAATLDQSDRGYRHFLSFFSDSMLAPYIQTSIKSKTRLTNGSELMITSGTVKGLNGSHSTIFCADEVELMDYCVLGKTGIWMPCDWSVYPNGVPIKELVGKKDFYVFSYSRTQKKFVLRKVKRVAKTGRRKIVEIRFGWYSGKGKYKQWKEHNIKVTPEHKVLLLNGEYCQAKELVVGSRLRALNVRQLTSTDYPYRELILPATHHPRQILEHRFIWSEIFGEIAPKHVVHHRDENILNNNVENLKSGKIEKHIRHHHEGEIRSDQAKINISKAGYDWRDNTNIGKYSHAEVAPWHIKINLEKAVEQNITIKEIAVQFGCEEHTLRHWLNKLHVAWDHLPDGRSRLRKLGKKYWSKSLLTRLYNDERLTVKQIAERLGVKPEVIGHSMRTLCIPLRRRDEQEFSEETRQLRSEAMTRSWAAKDRPYANYDVLYQLYVEEGLSTIAISKHFGVVSTTIKNHLKAFGIASRSLSQAQKLRFEQNHVVISVTPCGVEDVYNMEVEGTHNFVVDGGIVCKNSLLGEGLSISMSKKDKVHDRIIPAQDFLGSTRKRSVGTMSRLLDESIEKNMAVYNYCIFETLEKCTRLCKGDKNWGDCVVFDKCRGRAHDCHGWYPIADFIQKIVNLPKPTFEAQWENKSPSGGPKVFGSFWDENTHVLSWVDGGKFRSFHSIFGEREIPTVWRKLGGMDFGSHFYTGFIAIEPKYNIWVVYFEYYYNQERLMSTHADKIMAGPYFMQLRRIYGDPSAKQGILDMNALLKKKARRSLIFPAMNALVESVDAVKKKLEINPNNGLPGLFVMDTCIELRREMREWEHETLPDGKANLEAFEDGNDHAIDGVLRYPIYTYSHQSKISYRYATMDGV